MTFFVIIRVIRGDSLVRCRTCVASKMRPGTWWTCVALSGCVTVGLISLS